MFVCFQRGEVDKKEPSEFVLFPQGVGSKVPVVCVEKQHGFLAKVEHKDVLQ